MSRGPVTLELLDRLFTVTSVVESSSAQQRRQPHDRHPAERLAPSSEVLIQLELHALWLTGMSTYRSRDTSAPYTMHARTSAPRARGSRRGSPECSSRLPEDRALPLRDSRRPAKPVTPEAASVSVATGEVESHFHRFHRLPLTHPVGMSWRDTCASPPPSL